MSTRSVIGSDSLYRLYIAAQRVRYDDAGLAELPDEPGEEAFGGFCITARLNQYVENVAVRIDCSPEPEFLSTDGDDDFIHVPLVFRPWPLFANATGKMAAEAINPKSNRFPADNWSAP